MREVVVSSAQQLSLGHPLVHGDHFPAHLLLGNPTGLVLGIACAHGVAYFGSDQALLYLPVEEALAGIAGPQGSVAVESSDARAKAEHGIDELLGGWRERLNLSGIHFTTITCQR